MASSIRSKRGDCCCAPRAGLHEGDKLHFDEVYSNASRIALSYGVDNADGRRRTVTYVPQGQRQVTLQQLELLPASNDHGRKGMATP